MLFDAEFLAPEFNYYILEMGPWTDPRLPLTWVLFRPEWKKIENFDIFRGNFPNQKHKWLTRPDPGQKNLTQTHHYYILAPSYHFLSYFVVFIVLL